MLLMFHYIDIHDVIQDIMLLIKYILNDGDKLTLLWRSTINTFLRRFCEAQNEISERITVTKKDGRGMYLNPWRYK